MKIYLISHEDDKHAAAVGRITAAMNVAAADITRVNITPDTLPDDLPVPDWWEAGGPRWALVAAAITALENAAATESDCLIFEQDVIFNEELGMRNEELISHYLENLPDDWSQFYLGGQLLARNVHPPCPVEPVSEIPHSSFLIPHYFRSPVHRTHAWMTRGTACARVARWLREPFWASRQTLDWRLMYLHLQPDFKTYIPACDWFCGQAAGVSSLENQQCDEQWWFFTAEKFHAETLAMAAKAALKLGMRNEE